jgi:hypothetical protein
MSSQTQIRVRFDEFATAASVLPQMKRAPRGASASIPSDTLLTADAAGVVVETFALSSLVNADKAWAFNVSVNAKKLVGICDTLKKLGAGGNEVDLDLKDRSLWFAFRTTKISMPTLWVK